MAEEFLEKRDHDEFEKLLREISDGCDLFEKSMTPPVCNLGEEIEDTRHFKFPTLPSPEYRENDPWLPFSTQTVSLTPSVMVSEGPISMETQCQSPDWGDTHTFPLFNFSGKTVGKGCSSVPYDKIVKLEKRMRCKTKKTNEGTTLLEELKKIQGKIEDNLKEASRLTDQIEKAVIGKKVTFSNLRTM